MFKECDFLKPHLLPLTFVLPIKGDSGDCIFLETWQKRNF